MFSAYHGAQAATQRLVANVSKTETWKMKKKNTESDEMLNRRKKKINKKIWTADEKYFTEQHANAGL